MRQIAHLTRGVPYGALVMRERSAGKLARSVLRGLGGREPTWLPDVRQARRYAPCLAHIGIGRGLTASPLPHHRTSGSRLRRFGR